MTDRKWHKGPPPSVGWWPASNSMDKSVVRWWDGSSWSVACHRGTPIADVGYQAARKSDLGGVEWRDRPVSWPKRSRT